jgi:GxxExxY protein
MDLNSDRQLRIESGLPEEIESIAQEVIGCAIAVHRSLGPGLLESLYEHAMDVELAHAHIPFARQVRLPVHHRGVQIGTHVVDMIVAEAIVLELKAVEATHELHLANLPLGLLLNFNCATLRDGLRRVVNTHWQRPNAAPPSTTPHHTVPESQRSSQ